MESVKRGHYFQMLTLVYFVASSLLLGLILSYVNIEMGIMPILLISQFLMVGLVVVAYLYLTKASPSSVFMIKKLGYVDIAICVGIAFTIGPLLNLVNLISQFFASNQVTASLTETLQFPYLVTLAIAALTPAILEELLTRSIIISNYRHQSVLVVCVMSGLFFGFIHMNINQFMYAFVMGMVMCYVVMITGSVISSMVIHFVINASSITLLYVMQFFLTSLDDSGLLMSEMAEASSEVPITQLVVMVFVMLFIAAIFTPVTILLINELLKRHNKQWKGRLKCSANDFMSSLEENTAEAITTETVLQPKEKIITPVYITTVIIFLVFAIMTELSI